jgi:DNA invertase Pin-like site-specific DNA recombinase
MRVLAYLRVSTSEQADSRAGLDAQRAAITSEAVRRGWTEVEFIEDAGHSAKTIKRPGLEIALAALKRGDVGVLVVSKMDRLSRSLLDFAGIMQRAQREGWALVALDSPADLTTPSGEAMAGVLAVFSQLERRLIGERTRLALAERRKAGVTLGRPRTLTPAVAERIVREHEAGASLSDIARRLTAEAIPTAQGGAKWHASTVRAVVRSRATTCNPERPAKRSAE